MRLKPRMFQNRAAARFTWHLITADKSGVILFAHFIIVIASPL